MIELNRLDQAVKFAEELGNISSFEPKRETDERHYGELFFRSVVSTFTKRKKYFSFV